MIRWLPRFIILILLVILACIPAITQKAIPTPLGAVASVQPLSIALPASGQDAFRASIVDVPIYPADSSPGSKAPSGGLSRTFGTTIDFYILYIAIIWFYIAIRWQPSSAQREPLFRGTSSYGTMHKHNSVIYTYAANANPWGPTSTPSKIGLMDKIQKDLPKTVFWVSSCCRWSIRRSVVLDISSKVSAQVQLHHIIHVLFNVVSQSSSAEMYN